MKKRSILAMALTGGAAWLLAKANSSALRNPTPASSSTSSNYFQDISPQKYKGQVHKSLEIFTLTTPAMTYHVSDPSNILDTIAKEQGITAPFYDLDTCVRGVLSPKGQYGHLGHLDYQLNIVGRCDDYDYSKKPAATPVQKVDSLSQVNQAEINDLEKSLNVGGKS